jgi:small subunit ribosomal protein S21
LKKFEAAEIKVYSIKEKGADLFMSRIEVGPNEPLEKALRRFKKKIERDGILKVLKARKHYEKPSEIKRRKARSSKNRKRF